MNIDDFDYDLPSELIAQTPLDKRDSSRMMYLPKTEGKPIHTKFENLLDYLRPDDLMVFNRTRVIPARLIGHKVKTGGEAECLLLSQETDHTWECTVRPGKRLKVGAVIDFSTSEGVHVMNGTIIEEREGGLRLVEFDYPGILLEAIGKVGEVPLPPYIHEELNDPERYQTVYGYKPGSVAAPTAGLHFTKEMLDKIQAKGVELAEVILNVGMGTFKPVEESKIENHKMHSEYYEITKENAEKINKAKKEGRRVICVGTTSVRVVETVADENGIVQPGTGWTQIFIYPGYKFKVVDGLLTNFHLPKSTLLMLISALCGRERILDAYKEAVEQRYRFFSFGDCCLFL